MVQRTSSPVEFNTGRQQQYVQPSGGYVSPDVRAETTLEADSGRDRILSGILNEAEQTARKGFRRSLEDSYLEGVAKVGQIESEEELEGDMFSKDWKTAGYRDTMGKFAMADAEAQLQKDMPRLRQMTPEQFQEYMREYRTKLTPTLEGMSREQRNAAFANLVTSTRSAIKTHTVEHQKFIIETEERGVSELIGSKMVALTQELQRGNSPSYPDKVKDTFVTVASAIWNNQKFSASPGLRNRLTMQVMEHALESNNTLLYEQMISEKINIDGKEKTMFEALSLGEQEKMAGKYRVALERTASARNTLWNDSYQNMMFGIEHGTVTASLDDVTAKLDHGVAIGAISAEKRATERWRAMELLYKSGKEVLLTDAYMTNKSDVVQKHGSWSAALEAAEKSFVRAGMSQAEIMQKHLQAGNMGTPGAYTAAGKVADPAISQLEKADGTLDVKHAATLGAINEFFDKTKDNAIQQENFLAGMSEQNRLRFQRIRARMARGETTEFAWASVKKQEEEEARLTPQQRAVVRDNNAKEDTAFLQEVNTQGPFGRAWTSVKSLWSKEAALASTISPKVGLLESVPAAVEAAWANNARGAVQQSFANLNLATSGLPQSERFKSATADVIGRTINTFNAGPIILPSGHNVQSYFGVNASPDVMAKAIDKVLTPEQNGNRFVAVPVRGGFQVTQYNSNGDVMNLGGNFVPASEIVKEYREQLLAQAKSVDERIGDGKVAKAGNISVQYNGRNTAAVDESLMLQLRDNLVKHEGVKDTVYPDKSNKLYPDRPKVFTVGVGVSSTNKHFPAGSGEGVKVSEDVIRESFRAASNDAARIGARLQRSLGLNDKGFLLAAEMAYQSGSIDSPKHSDSKNLTALWDAMRTRDLEAAKKAFTQTAVYKNSHAERKQAYLSLIEQSLKG